MIRVLSNRPGGDSWELYIVRCSVVYLHELSVTGLQGQSEDGVRLRVERVCVLSRKEGLYGYFSRILRFIVRGHAVIGEPGEVVEFVRLANGDLGYVGDDGS